MNWPYFDLGQSAYPYKYQILNQVRLSINLTPVVSFVELSWLFIWDK